MDVKLSVTQEAVAQMIATLIQSADYDGADEMLYDLTFVFDDDVAAAIEARSTVLIGQTSYTFLGV